MAFRSISTNNAPATSLAVTAPSGIVNGDILVAWSVSDASGNNQAFPAGFVAVTGSPQDLSVFDASEIAVAIKVAASESGNYTLTGTAAIIGGVACFSGRVQSTTPHKVSATKSDSSHASPYTITSAAFASATTNTADIIYIAESDGASNDITHSAPAGYTNDADICQTSTFERQFVFAHKDGVAAGETGTLTSTGTGSAAAWAVFAIALSDGGTTGPGYYGTRQKAGQRGPFDQRGFLKPFPQDYTQIAATTATSFRRTLNPFGTSKGKRTRGN